MPISAIDLIHKTGLDINLVKTVKWNNNPSSTEMGIYIVSTSKDPSINSNTYESAPIENETLEFWLKKVSTFLLDKKPNPNVQELRLRLSKFWLPDESILYVGRTESMGGLSSRVNQYYNTELGEKRPHAGGHWIKTLKILNQLYIHYLPDNEPKTTKVKLLQNFSNQVSLKTRKELYDQNLPIPFADMELEKGNRKQHGISKSVLSPN